MSVPSNEGSAGPIDDDTSSPVEDALFQAKEREDITGQIALDLYGLKIKAPVPSLAPAEDLPKPLAPVRRDWRAVWNDCVGHLQDLLVGLTAVLASLPRNTVKLLDSTTTFGESIAVLSRRVACGRARADHHEDERIADVEGAIDSEIGEDEARREVALARLENWIKRVNDQGGVAKLVETPDRRIIVIAVQPELERNVLEAAHQKLQNSSITEADESLTSLRLSQRVINILEAAGVSTVAQLSTLTADDVLRIRNIGAKSLEELRPYLRQ